MLSISKRDVPEYLRTSPLFENAFADEEGDSEHAVMEIPKDCC